MINHSENQYQNDIVQNNPIIDLPEVYRVVKIEREHLSEHLVANIAQLYNDQASLSVSWTSNMIDEAVTVGMLVIPRWDFPHTCDAGNIRVKFVDAVLMPCETINLFETLPFDWIRNRELVSEAKQIINELPPYFALLFTAIFWDCRRLYRFINGPSSLNGHHNWKYGNFKHTIEVVNHAKNLSESSNFTCSNVLIMAALLHDAAKADEYRRNNQRDCFEMSTRGVLIGHKMSVIEWIAAAVALYNIKIPAQEYLGLMHCLTAVNGAPDWMGLRKPMSPECTLLSMADRLSGEDDLYNQTMPTSPGFGKYHKHLKGRPYFANQHLAQ